MDGIPPALPTDSEDIAWALETAEALWKRGERVDAVVWVRRAAQAAGEGEDAKRAAALARSAAELGDWIGSHTITGESLETPAHRQSEGSLEAVDALLGAVSSDGHDVVALSARDMEVVSASDFEAGFASSKPVEGVRSSGAPQGATSEAEVMTVSLHAPDVEIIEDVELEVSEEFPEEEPTPVLRHPRSPVPAPGVPSAADAHAGMLDPWAEAEARRTAAAHTRADAEPARVFEDEEVVTSAKRNAAQAPRIEREAEPIVPRPPKAPRIPGPAGRSPSTPDSEEAETTTYRQINPRSPRGPVAAAPSPPPAPPKPPPPRRPVARPQAPSLEKPETVAPLAKRAASPPPDSTPPTKASPVAKPVSVHAPEKSVPPALDLLEMANAVSVSEAPAAPTPSPPPPEPAPAVSGSSDRSVGHPSNRPTAPPPSSVPRFAMPSGAPTRPKAGPTLLDLGGVEALTDLPDDAREAFAAAATMHKIATDEEVSHFALALVVEGEIDVSAQIVDAPALRLERNSILRSRGTIIPGVALRLVCASDSALLATWDDAAVESAFRTCPWVEEDLRAVTDRVQAKAGVTMGPLGERFDQSLREHLTNKLTIRSLAPGEVLVAQGKPSPIAIVGIGDIVVTKEGARPETLGPGDFVFPSQTLAHAPAPATAAAGAGGAVVLYGDRAVAQDLLMSFPPLLEVLATL